MRPPFFLITALLYLISCTETIPPTSVPPTPTATLAPTATVPPTATPEPDLNTELVLHLPFDGNANDMSGNGNNGTILGATLTEDRHGNADSAFAFDGVDDFIEIPHSQSIGLVSKGTVAAWLFVEEQAQSTWYTILEKTDPEREGHSRYGIWQINEQAEWCIQATQIPSHYCIDSPEPLTVGQWHHIVGTWDGEKLRLFVNGMLSLEKTYQRDVISSTNYSLMLGTDPYNQPEPLFTKMRLDEVRVYRRAISADEVQQLFTLNP